MADLNWKKEEPISTSQIRDYLMEIFVERTKNQKHITIWTWDGGLELIHKMLKEKAETFLKADQFYDN